MDESEIKLIYFDSAYYLPDPIPLTELDDTGKRLKSNKVGHDHLRRVFREQTNQDELKSVIKTAPSLCSVCQIYIDGTNDVLNHIFSKPHMDKYFEQQGSISSSGFAFWKRLFKIFPKNRTPVSKEFQAQELNLLSSTLNLHSRPSHWTVEVSSSDEYASALLNFISASFDKSQRLFIFVKDKEEGEVINNFVRVNFPAATLSDWMKQVTERRTLRFLLIEGPNGRTWTYNAVIYLRPPGGNRKWPDPLAAHAAITLCSPRIQSSLMLINGRDEMSQFRAFENRFMQPRETPLLTISSVTALEDYREVARVEAAKKSTVENATVPQGIRIAPGETKKIRIPKGSILSFKTVNPETGLSETIQHNPAVSLTQSIKTVKRRGGKEQRNCLVLKDAVATPKSIANASSIDESEVKKWHTIFSPFDEEEGKAVEELIERMTDYC